MCIAPPATPWRLHYGPGNARIEVRGSEPRARCQYSTSWTMASARTCRTSCRTFLDIDMCDRCPGKVITVCAAARRHSWIRSANAGDSSPPDISADGGSHLRLPHRPGMFGVTTSRRCAVLRCEPPPPLSEDGFVSHGDKCPARIAARRIAIGAFADHRELDRPQSSRPAAARS